MVEKASLRQPGAEPVPKFANARGLHSPGRFHWLTGYARGGSCRHTMRYRTIRKNVTLDGTSEGEATEREGVVDSRLIFKEIHFGDGCPVEGPRKGSILDQDLKVDHLA